MRLFAGTLIFFFQAEDGIRDYKVTGVQTCALPISLGIVPGFVQRGVVGRGHGEAGIGVGGLGAGLAGDLGRPVLALPVDQVIGLLAGVLVHAFPPHVVVIGQRDVREDHVLVEAGDRKSVV